ncbi:MAG: tail fiber domain-containing protein, partial [Candidatus Moraniibacteriota bacterium]
AIKMLVGNNGGTEAMTILNTGNVGIGTTNPASKLELAASSSGSMAHALRLSNSSFATNFKAGEGAYMSFTDGFNENVMATIGGGSLVNNNGSHGFLAFSTRGNRPGEAVWESMRIDDAGNVGIGTTVPSGKLNIKADDSSALYIPLEAASDTSWHRPVLQGIRSKGTFSSRTAVTAGSGLIALEGDGWDGTTSGFGSSVNLEADGTWTVSSHPSRILLYTVAANSTAASERLRIDNAGNVGIGTASPGAKLDVSESGSGSTANPMLKFSGGGWSTPLAQNAALNGGVKIHLFNSSTQKIQLGMDDSANLWFNNAGTNAGGYAWYTSNDNTSVPTAKVTMLNSGNVGIGTTAPGNKLHVAGGISAGDSKFFNSVQLTDSINGTAQSWMWTADTANTLTFGVGAVGTANRKMTIDSTGNVGIGTTAPSNKLEIAITGTAPSMDIAGQANGTIGFSDASVDWPGMSGKQAAVNSPGLFIVGATNDTNSRADMELSVRESDSTDYATLTSAAFKFTRYTTDLVTILRNGNVGIGTTGPATKLTVQGANGVTGAAAPQLASTNGLLIDDGTSPNIQFRSNTTGNAYIFFGDDDADAGGITYDFTNDVMKFRSGATGDVLNIKSGNVGIGTTLPAYKFHVNSSIAAVAAFESTTTPYIVLRQNGVDKFYIGDRAAVSGSGGVGYDIWSAGDLRFFTNNGSTPKVTIDNTGNVGIGTTAPGAKLSVASPDDGSMQIRMQGTAAPTYYWEMGREAMSTGDFRINESFAGSVSNKFTIRTSNGNVGIGTAGPGYKLTVAGMAWVTSGAWSGSDQRWKKNIQPIANSLDKVLQLSGVSYDWRADEFPANNFDNKTHLGFIAQDVEKIAPDLVTTGADGFKGLDYNGFSSLLVGAVQELASSANKLALSANKQQSQISGLTENQNKLAQQITSNLADQNLSVTDKITIIGASLDNLNAQQLDQQLKTIKEQVQGNTSSVATLQSQYLSLENRYTALESQLSAISEFLVITDGVFDLKGGFLKAAGINAGSIIADTVTTKDIEASGTVNAGALELSDQISGTGAIKAGTLESIKILTTQINASVKLYITSRGSTAGKLLYYDETKVEDGVGFTVKIDAPAIGQDIKFNWLIVK